jgi:hypothetical protein
MKNTASHIEHLDHPDPLVALELYLVDSPCPYLEHIYHAIKDKLDELKVTA